jgi:hypothetical protein
MEEMLMRDKPSHTWTQVQGCLEELEKQTDRGRAVVAGAVLEDQLELVIHKRVVEVDRKIRDRLFRRKSISTNIDLGYALGLYDHKIRQMMHLFRDIRNVFAHTIDPVSFDHHAIGKLIQDAKNEGMELPKDTPKDVFMGCFVLPMCILYMEEQIDIRVKPINLDTLIPDLARTLLKRYLPSKP